MLEETQALMGATRLASGYFRQPRPASVNPIVQHYLLRVAFHSQVALALFCNAFHIDAQKGQTIHYGLPLLR